MFKLLTLVYVGFGIILSFAGYGQAYAPLGSLPMQYNSSFAGQAESPRFSSNIRYGRQGNEYTRTRGVVAVASYDQFIPAIRSGIGITASYGNGKHTTDFSSGNVSGFFSSISSQTTSVTLAIAPKISFKGKYTLSPSVDFTYGFTTIQRTINPRLDTIFNPDYTSYTAGSRAGMLLNATNFYVGYSVNLFTQTKSTNEEVGKSSFYSALQMGYTFERNSGSVFSFTPQLVIRIAKDWYTSRWIAGVQGFNANFRYKQFIWGVNDGSILLPARGTPERKLTELGGIHIGWQTDKLRIMLTNSYYAYRQYEEFRYTGNLSVRYILGDSGKPGRGWQ